MSGRNSNRMDRAHITAGSAEWKEWIFALCSFGADHGLPAQWAASHLLSLGFIRSLTGDAQSRVVRRTPTNGVRNVMALVKSWANSFNSTATKDTG